MLADGRGDLAHEIIEKPQGHARDFAKAASGQHAAVTVQPAVPNRWFGITRISLEQNLGR
jgi:hypothetical protein